MIVTRGVFMVANEFYLINVWETTLNLLSTNQMISYDIYNSISGDSKLVALNEEKATILCKMFINTVIINQSHEKIEQALESVIKRHVDVEAKLTQDSPVFDNLIKPEVKKVDKRFFKAYLDPNFTFENFVIGRSNIQSQSASIMVANNPGFSYNPLFIYGNSGLGKTHLLNAIGNKISENFPDYKIGFVSGIDFVEGVAESIKNHEIDEFKREFYNLDVLLVDDIQFIAGKEKTHEVFFSIFNELVNNRKQICLTSDRMPQDIKGLEERIISRFNQGLNVNIEAPEYETSMNILKKKLMLNGGQNIDDEVLSYIATNFSKDVRQLEGALNRLLFFSITFAPVDHITIEIALEAFKDQIPEASNELSVVSIKKAVCDYYGITKQQLESKIRTKKIAIPRQIAMYLTRSLLDMPYKDIGNIFGKRDHSTVISACEKIEDLFKRDEMYQRSINEIKALIKG